MVPLQSGLQGPKNAQGRLRIRLLHTDGAEPALQGGILFNILPVFFPGGGPNHLQFSPAQGRLEDVGSVNGPLRCPGTYNGVHLIHKEDHIRAAPDLRQHIPEPLLKFSPVFCPRHQAGHIQAV